MAASQDGFIVPVSACDKDLFGWGYGQRVGRLELRGAKAPVDVQCLEEVQGEETGQQNSA